MIAVALASAVAAALLFVARPKPAEFAARLAGADHRRTRRRLRVRWWMAIAPAGIGCVVAAAMLTGPAGAAVTLATMSAAVTVLRLAYRQRRRRAALVTRRSVTQACAALAAQLRIGRVPSEALTVAAQDCPVLNRARSALELGGDVVSVWRGQSTDPGCGGFADLARAWRVSAETGAPMAGALEQVADSLADDQALASVVAGELAGPRATGKIMAVLPLCGIALGYALGGDPIGFLLHGPLGWGCLVCGVGLAALGVLWVEMLAQQGAGEHQ
jgi:tight adherence protein B